MERVARAEAEQRVRLSKQARLRLAIWLPFLALFVGWNLWDGSASDLWHLVWLLPLLIIVGMIWLGAESVTDAILHELARPFRTYTYTPNYYGDEEEEAPDYSMAEIVTEEAPEAERIAPDAGWKPPPGIWVKPRDDWGFVETIDGELAEPFEVQIDEAGAVLFDGRRGWRGRIRSARHKYGYMNFTMRPRHAPFDGIVSIDVTNGTHSIYSGIAETRGLECDWS